jgi:hypothetical protein
LAAARRAPLQSWTGRGGRARPGRLADARARAIRPARRGRAQRGDLAARVRADLYSTNQNTVRGGLVYGELGAELGRHGLRYASTDKPFANAFRPLPGYSGYRTPVDGLFITGAATWPGGGVTGLPGQLAAKAVLKATRRRGWR